MQGQSLLWQIGDVSRGIATVINFSTNEALFLRHCLEEALHFSSQIIIPVCDHFFDGSPENQELLNSIYAAHPEVKFIQYAWSERNFYGRHSPHFWHDLSRLLGIYFLRADCRYVLFLDVDEIVEGKELANWLAHFPLTSYTALRLACYWYFREPSFRATEWEEGPLLICKDALHYDALMHPCERAGTFALAEGQKRGLVTSEGQLPMVHHYSWVRSKEALLRKVRSWGHRGERDWEGLIEAEFSKPFSGTDFVHGYSFTEVESSLRPSRYPSSNTNNGNVISLSTADIHKIDLELKFNLR